MIYDFFTECTDQEQLDEMVMLHNAFNPTDK